MGPRQMTAVSLSGIRKAQGHDTEVAVVGHGLHVVGLDVRLGVLQGEQARDAGAVDVHVEQADLLARLGQGYGDVGRNRAFAHAALAGKHHDLVLDARQGLGDLFVLRLGAAAFGVVPGGAAPGSAGRGAAFACIAHGRLLDPGRARWCISA
jgi:hypothetical protein